MATKHEPRWWVNLVGRASSRAGADGIYCQNRLAGSLAPPIQVQTDPLPEPSQNAPLDDWEKEWGRGAGIAEILKTETLKLESDRQNGETGLKKFQPALSSAPMPFSTGSKATLHLRDHRSTSCPNSQQRHSRRPVYRNFSSSSCLCRGCGLGQAALQIQCPTASFSTRISRIRFTSQCH
jgi:hypothetical protein